MRQAIVVGAGISGLSTALLLARHAWQVTIVAKSFPPHTTSDKAAAFWSPYYAHGHRVARWAEESYHEYERLAADASSGISMTMLHRFRKNGFEEETDWQAALPEGKLTCMDAATLPAGYAEGFVAEVPLIETQIFLPWLIRQLTGAGGKMVQRDLKSLEEINSGASLLINCSGLGARTLANDAAVIPVKGQVAMLDAHLDIPIFLDESVPTYIVQRKDGCIIGGTREEHVYSEATDAETVAAITMRATEWVPQLKAARLLTQWAGLRPYRHEVRLERQGNIIHNYGHGGSGFTLAWGCAGEVMHLALNELLT